MGDRSSPRRSAGVRSRARAVIRVQKPEPAPMILRERGTALTRQLCSRVEAGEPPSFDRDVYGAGEVKLALRAAQHDKCCFCESKLGHAQFGDVEHFRPKASTQQSPDALPTTGYYWVAYAWGNLYLSCEVCNRRHKRSLFPLANPERRASSHYQAAQLEAEQPLFIDPGREDPTAFIEFRREYAAPVGGSVRGSASLDALQLNRPALVERRRERRQLLRVCVIVIAKELRSELSEADQRDVLLVLQTLVTAATDNGEYSSMSRSLLRRVDSCSRSMRSRPKSGTTEAAVLKQGYEIHLPRSRAS